MNDSLESATRLPSDLRFLAAVQQIMVREGYKNNRQFLAAHGLNLALLNKIRTGLQSAPQEVVTMLATRYGLSLNYIFLGQEPMFGTESLPSEKAKTYRVPLLSIRATATFAESYLDDLENELEETIEFFSDTPPRKGSLVVEIMGDSMAEQLNEGSKILVSPVNQADWKYANSGVYAVLYGKNHFVVKRIKDNQLLTEQRLVLHSDNPKHGSTTVMAEDLRRLWHVDLLLQSRVR
jgi:phage repressor protein C with HTH and peptisase S24 domain